MFPQEHTYQQERDSSPLEADPRDFPGDPVATDPKDFPGDPVAMTPKLPIPQVQSLVRELHPTCN